MEINFRKNYKFWLTLIVSIIVILLMSFYEINLNGFEGIEVLMISLCMIVIILIISVIAILIYYSKNLTIEKLFWRASRCNLASYTVVGEGITQFGAIRPVCRH